MCFILLSLSDGHTGVFAAFDTTNIFIFVLYKITFELKLKVSLLSSDGSKCIKCLTARICNRISKISYFFLDLLYSNTFIDNILMLYIYLALRYLYTSK